MQRLQAGETGLSAGWGAAKSKIMGKWSEIAVSTISLRERESPREIIRLSIVGIVMTGPR